MKVAESSAPIYTSSPLLKKVGKLGLELPDDLAKLAVARGLRYYDGLNEMAELQKEPRLQISVDELSNAELAIAMLSPDLPQRSAADVQARQRVAAAVLSAEDVDASALVELAMAEHCCPIVQWIATCGLEVEPENVFWTSLLEQLPPIDKPVRSPHPTRFFAMSGIVRGEKKTVKHWIRVPVAN